jgi:iron complex transport system substrate-binding protein
MNSYIRTPAALLLLRFFLIAPLLFAAGCRSHDTAETTERSRDSTNAIRLRDAHGEELRLPGAPLRVISLAPNLTEMVYALDAGDRLVGRTAYCDYPAAAAAVTIVSDMQTPDYDKILTLRPDLVLMTFAGNSEGAYRKLKDLGIPVFAFGASTVDGVISTIDTLGILLGRRENAARLGADMRRRIDSIRRHAQSRPAVPTFIVIDRSPLITVSQGFVADALAIAGGRNIAAGSATAYPQFSREELLRLDPEVILYPDTRPDAVVELLKIYPEWNRLQAVRNGRIYRIQPDLVSRPGPRIADGIELLYRTLHRSAPVDTTGSATE